MNLDHARFAKNELISHVGNDDQVHGVGLGRYKSEDWTLTVYTEPGYRPKLLTGDTLYDGAYFEGVRVTLIPSTKISAGG